MNETVKKSAPAGLALITGAGLMAIINGGTPEQKIVPVPQRDGGEFAVEDFGGEGFEVEYLAFCGGDTTCANPFATVYFDGRVKLGDGITLDKASQEFWAGLAEKFPQAKAQICGEETP